MADVVERPTHIFDTQQKVEDQEQQLIHHIRSSVVEKKRELFLVDFIIDLRRNRRELISSLNKRIQFLEKGIVEREKDFSNLRQTISNFDNLQNETSELSSQLQIKELEIQRLKHNHEVSLKEIDALCEIRVKSELFKLSRYYEEKLDSLKSSFKSLEKVKVADETSTSEKVQVATNLLKAEFKARLIRYREALENSASREKLLHESLNSKTSELAVCQEKLQKLENEYFSYTSEEPKRQQVVLKLSSKLEQTLSRLDEVSKKYDELILSHSLQINALEDSHRKELSSIDDKIRQKLLTKDKMIRVLQQENSGLIAKLNTMNQQIQELNSLV